MLDWVGVGLANGGDGVVITAPSLLNRAYFSVVYNLPGGGSYQKPTVSVPLVGSNQNCYLSDNQYGNAGSWVIGDIGKDETPGLPNTPANDAWIQSMRKPSLGQSTSKTACIEDGDSYNFFGIQLTASGPYTSISKTPEGCDDTVKLYLTVTKVEDQTISGCSSVVYNGVTYTSSQTIKEDFKSAVTGCDSLLRTINIVITEAIAVDTNICRGQGQSYVFDGNTLTKTGNYKATFKTAGGCDSTVNLYLTIPETATETYSGCESYNYNGTVYTSSTTLPQTTIKSVVSGCDSLYKTVNIIIINKNSDTTRLTQCLQKGNSYSFNGSVLTKSGSYNAMYKTSLGCDSVVNLRLIIAAEEALTLSDCNSVIYNGISYTASTVVKEDIKSKITGCDSLNRTVNIIVGNKIAQNISGCIKQGETYPFNNQNLTKEGSYSATFINQSGCDSTVNLYLTVAKKEVTTLASCKQVTYNGVSYTSSQTIQETIKSKVSGCDSLYQTVNIVISDKILINAYGCIKRGESYQFGNRKLTTAGIYANTFTTSDGCDSTVNLYLTVADKKSESFNGCGVIVYNGKTYTSSTLFQDTVKSLTSGCDSLYKEVSLVVNPLPQATITGNLSICKGESTTLSVSGNSVSVRWLSFPEGNTVTVSPQSNTMYQLEAVSNAGCRDTITASVSVEDFVLSLSALPNPAGSGSIASFTTSSPVSYNILAWQPQSVFALQTAASQTLRTDTTTTVTVIGRSSVNGCLDTTSVKLIVTKTNPNDLFIPNAFTPNGDGVNDRFFVYGTTVREYSLMIFSQWGELLHETKNSAGWDGIAKGRKQPVGVYVYTATITMNDGTTVTRKGSVNLIR